MNIETNIAVPHKHFVSMVFDEYQFSINKLSFGHEITHLLSYFWDKQLFHLEFLEEGLAVYLDQSESDKHLDFLNKLHSRIDNGYIDLSLNIEYVKRATDYVKAGSFVKYLIESYGIKKFKKLYLRSVVELRNDIYVINGKRLPKNYLKILLKECYGENPTSIQRKWLENVGIIL